ncbi:MAG: aminotransferase class V-fold PLP-dependent enzyme, partial [bacterium]|nr:aminotransferase class V-fold PLP-dependent enzyme [bacterium]
MLNRRNFLKSTSVGLLSLSSLSVRCAEQQDKLSYLISRINSAPDFDYVVNIIRDHQVLESGMAYMNTGSLGTCPSIILEYIYDLLYELEKNPVSQNWGPLGQEMENVREKVAGFIGAEKDEVILTRNTTEGMNCVGSSFKLNTGDEILTTNHEHPGGMVCWEYSAKLQGATIRTIEMPYPVENKEQILNLIEDNITPRTKVCSVSHVSTITGLRMPLEEISQITRPKGILLVCDGAQAPGMLKTDV